MPYSKTLKTWYGSKEFLLIELRQYIKLSNIELKHIEYMQSKGAKTYLSDNIGMFKVLLKIELKMANNELNEHLKTET